MKIKHHPNGSIDLIHEIHPGATSCGGPEIDADRPRRISLRVVSRDPKTQEPDVLDIEGDDEDVLDVLDQMVSQVRLMIMHDGRADPHEYPHVLRNRDPDGPRCRRCGTSTGEAQGTIAIPMSDGAEIPTRHVWAHLCKVCEDDFKSWLDNSDFQDGMRPADVPRAPVKDEASCDSQINENPRCQCGHQRSDHEWGPFGDGSCFYAYNCECRAFLLRKDPTGCDGDLTHVCGPGCDAGEIQPDDICRCGHPAGDHAMDSALGSNCGHGDDCECAGFRLLVRYKDIP